jgi:hypothetical protein
LQQINYFKFFLHKKWLFTKLFTTETSLKKNIHSCKQKHRVRKGGRTGTQWYQSISTSPSLQNGYDYLEAQQDTHYQCLHSQASSRA